MRRLNRGWVVAPSIFVLCLAFGAAVAMGLIRIPSPYNPFAPLDVQEPITLVTWLKLLRLEHDAAACFQALDSAELRYTRLPDRTLDDGCVLTDTVRVRGSEIDFSRPFIATCPLAVSIALFERHTLQPVARRQFGREVRRVEHVGTYACRNVYGRERGRRSQHASANAIDVTGFVLGDGTRISVLDGWSGDPARAEFLQDVRDGACRFFDAVLSPDYNAAHRDHFHLDMGSFQACR